MGDFAWDKNKHDANVPDRPEAAILACPCGNTAFVNMVRLILVFERGNARTENRTVGLLCTNCTKELDIEGTVKRALNARSRSSIQVNAQTTKNQ